MDWNGIFDINGNNTGRAELLPPEKVSAAFLAYLSDPRFNQVVERQSLEGLFARSLSLLFIVATVFLFNSLFRRNSICDSWGGHFGGYFFSVFPP